VLNIILRFLGLAERFGMVRAIHKITYVGQGLSLNQFYAGGHYMIRKNLAKKYKAIFRPMFKSLPQIKKYSILLTYNSRMDVDNTVGMTKVFVDALRTETDKKLKVVTYKGHVDDDNKNFYKGLFLIPNDSLPYNTYEFYIIQHR
jgi:hypothetical protein